MKKCSICSETKPSSEFHKRAKMKDGLNSACKSCISGRNAAFYNKVKKVYPYSKSRKKYRHRLANLLKEIKTSKPCASCHLFWPHQVMDFHHRDPSTKLFELGKASNGIAWAKIETEIAKCDLLCANCHRMVEAAIRS